MTLYPRRRSRPFGLPSTPFNPQSGTFLPLSEPGDFAEVTIVEVGHDALLCSDREGRKALILKPWALRGSTFAGQTLNDVSYTSSGVDVRVATEEPAIDHDPMQERVDPPYFVGEKVMAYRRVFRDAALGVVNGDLTGIQDGSHRLFWEDMNTAGRHWQRHAGALVVALGTESPAGTYQWARLRGDGPDTGEAREIDDTAGLEPGTVALLWRVEGVWEFSFPVENCP